MRSNNFFQMCIPPPKKVFAVSPTKCGVGSFLLTKSYGRSLKEQEACVQEQPSSGAKHVVVCQDQAQNWL